MPVVRWLLALALALSTLASPAVSAPKPPSPVPDAQVDAPALAPGNDGFGSAVAVSAPQTLSGSNVGATTEEGEPLPCGSIGATVWYRLIVEEPMSLAASTGGALDTVLAAYRGASLSELELLGCNDDAGYDLGSKVGFAAVPGETYYLQVGGYAGERGTFTLSLGVGGAISGVVTGEGEELGGACIDLYTAEGEWLEYAFVEGPAASYHFAGLAAGEYRLGFFDCSEEQRHVHEYYDDAGDLEAATVVSVVEGSETSDIDAVLSLGATISGTVTGFGASELMFACVDVVRPDGTWVTTAWGQGGTYTVGGLTPGEYLLRFEDCWTGQHAYEWYEDADSRLTATPVSVDLGEVLTGIDVELPLGAVVRGEVTDEATGEPLAPACVRTHDAAGDVTGWGYGGGDDDYRVSGLRGDVSLMFSDCSDGSHAYEWYDDAATRAASTAVRTTAGEEVSGIDAALGPAGWIRGRLTNHVGAPARGVCVDAFDATGEWVGWGGTGAQGRYTVRGLRGADYRVLFSDCWAGGYRDEWWDGAASMGEASPIPVTVGSITQGIDAVLEAPRLIFLQDGGSTEVAEGGDGDRFGVGLGQASSSDISVTLETDGQISVEPRSLDFVSGDATAREVRVEAVDDEIAEGPHWTWVTLRTTGDDPVLGGLVQRFWVFVDDDDLEPAATEIVYEGDTSVPRGTWATFAARLIDAETGDGIPWEMLVLRLGNQSYPMFTDEEGYADRQVSITAPYGTYEVRVSYPGDDWYAASEVTVPFEVAWQHVFEDDLAAGRSVLWNPPTRELRFVAPGDASAIKEDASYQDVGPLTAVLFNDPSLTVELDWDRGSGAFVAAVKTPSNAYALQGTV